MSVEKFQNKYRIPSARATWHDYSGGVYFVTICTAEHNHFFGEITNGKMQLTKIGEYTDGCVQKIEQLHSDISVPLYVVMPNHIHLIVFVDEQSPVPSVETSYYGVSKMKPEKVNNETPRCDVSTGKNEKMQAIANKCGRLSHVISRFKSAVTRYANKNQIPFGWQTRFHDRIVRNQNELNRIAEYIENNPLNWTTDRYYS